MARRVFFSFHYDRDVRRVVQVRNSWVFRPGDSAQPFYDKAEFEEVKRRAGGIANWIEQQLEGTSVTVVLFGAETASRDWVKHEIKRSHELGKGMLAIDIHRLKDPQHGEDVQGANPMRAFPLSSTTSFADIYPSYDWVLNDGYHNMPTWIENAAKAAGR
jgi:hypothetical protein